MKLLSARNLDIGPEFSSSNGALTLASQGVGPSKVNLAEQWDFTAVPTCSQSATNGNDLVTKGWVENNVFSVGGTPAPFYIPKLDENGENPTWQPDGSSGGGGGSSSMYSSGPHSLSQNSSVILNVGTLNTPILDAWVMEAGSAESGVIKGYTTTSSSEFTIQGASHIGFSSSGISLKKTVNNTNTVLLIPFNIEDGTNSSFFDTTGKTITRYGNPVLINSGVSGFFGNACGSFDGDTDHLVVAAHSDFAIGYSSITYEFRMRATSIQSTRNYLLRHGTNTDVEVGITIGGSTASDWNSSGGFIGLHVSYHGIAWGLSLAGTSNVCDGNFHHIAITRNTENNVWSIYVDGVLQSSSAYTYSISNSDVNIGGQSYPGSYRSFNGQLDQVAITKSLVYTGVFTPPSNQLNYIEYAATGSPYWVHVATTDMLNVSQISKIVSLTITQVEKTDTSVRYAYTMDGGTTWKNAAGVTLSGLNDITNNGSTASSIQTLFTNFIPSSEDTLFGIAISLYSAYYTVTPSVSVLSITYDGPEHWEKNTSGYQIKTFIGVTGTVVFKRTAAGSSTVYVMARNDS